MNGQIILAGFCVGSAAVGLWLVARFPRLGPQRTSTVLAAVVVTMLALQPAGAVFAVVATIGPIGPALALLLVVFPALTAAFWAAACGLRAMAGLRPRV